MITFNVKQLINEHGQNFVRQVFAERLRKEGFVSNNDVHWYRLVNNEVVQSIFFHTPGTSFPILLEISYGCHPLFLVPDFPQGVYCNSNGYYSNGVKWEIFRAYGYVTSDKRNSAYSQEACVMCATDPTDRIAYLESLLLKLNAIQTVEDCYQSHKKWYRDIIEHYPTRDEYILTIDFMDEAVYFCDTEFLPLCEKNVVTHIQIIERRRKMGILPSKYKGELERLLKLKSAIMEGNREQHLRYLAEQKQKTIKLLQKNVGITVKID